MGRPIALKVLFVSLLAIGCRPVDPCLNGDEFNVRLGDTLVITACSKNAEMYNWLVDRAEPNLFLDDPLPFYNHYVDSGGTACDRYIRIYFHDTGDHLISLDFAKLRRKQKCDDELEFPLDKSERASVRVHVKDTNVLR
ncbi:MAG: hypothetical protein R2813_11770 [Flavobacteriales bacterium]